MNFGEETKAKLIEAIYKQPTAVKSKCIALARHLNTIYASEKRLSEELCRRNHESYERLRLLHEQVLAVLFEGGGAALADADAFFTAEERAKTDFSAPAARVDRRGWWLRVLRLVPAIADHVEAQDGAALEHLTDVRLVTQPTRPDYTIEFHFEPNAFFHNERLAVEAVFDDSGDDIAELRSTAIQWKDGMDLTSESKMSKSRGKNRSRKPITVKKRSFFLLFANLRQPDEEEEDEEVEHGEPPSDAQIFAVATEVLETLKVDFFPCLVPLVLGVGVSLLGNADRQTETVSTTKPECKAQ